MQLLVQMQCLVTFTLGQLCDRNTRPAGNNTCDLFLTDVLMYQRKIFILNFLFLNFQLFLQLWKFSILQFCRFFQIIILLCSLDLILDLLDLFTLRSSLKLLLKQVVAQVLQSLLLVSFSDEE